MMNKVTISGKRTFYGTLRVPGDKSISHRALMLGSLALGKSVVTGLLESEDCLNTMRAFECMGIHCQKIGSDYEIEGKGLYGLRDPSATIDCGNSGTTIRLLAGILAGQPFKSILTGDESLLRRPMDRIIIPLTQMGGRIESYNNTGRAPLTIYPSELQGIVYRSPVASAQVKSSVLLAGLYASGQVCFSEPSLSRDHTERMFSYMGVTVETQTGDICLASGQQLQARHIDVPGDISAAAFFIIGALITPGSKLVIQHVGINPTRTGLLDVLKKMGASIKIIQHGSPHSGEPVADIEVEYSSLHGVRIAGDLIPRLIDEIPVLAIAGAHADGDFVVEDAAELRVKESDRIKTIVENLRNCGVSVDEKEDGFIIHPSQGAFHPSLIHARMDHRIAMSFMIAAAAVDGCMEVDGIESIPTSYPQFIEDYYNVAHK